jgi:hypothetical protein
MNYIFNDPINPNQLNPNLIELEGLMAEYDIVMSLYQQASKSYDSYFVNDNLVNLNSQLISINEQIIDLLNKSSPDFQKQITMRMEINNSLLSELQSLISEQKNVNETINNYNSLKEEINISSISLNQFYMKYIFFAILLIILIIYFFYLLSKSSQQNSVFGLQIEGI